MGLNPAESGGTRDYATAVRAMVVWLDPRVPGEATLLRQFLAGINVNSPWYGWFPEERSGVAFAATYGMPVFAASGNWNFTVLGSDVTPPSAPAVPPKPPLSNKIYVTIFVSDGDNIVEDERVILAKWVDARRGSIPLNWTMSPALVDLAPTILNYYRASATPNDVLVSGPSGLGYTYPDEWTPSQFVEYADRSAQYFDRSGMTIVTVWSMSGPNNNSTLTELSDARMSTYASTAPHLLGITDQVGNGDHIVAGLPKVALACPYCASEAELETPIDATLSSWNGSAPVFVAVQANQNKGVGRVFVLEHVVQHYAANPNVVFVRGDHFFQLVREANGLALNP
jgi:hypothetical protein